ncbi:hypothetical protein BDFG_05804 [Blastomyces dermatitidis ATCC 26199]|nr:hypothetical protein BDFG_05804 [Blastomyces dermatitidis ATCC 26199]
MASNSRTGLVNLPKELIQMIAMLVELEDADMCRMARTCRYFAEAIIPPNSGVWRRRFLQKYDHPPPDKSSEEVRVEYKVRSIMLAQTPSFRDGEGRKEKLWLSVLTTLFAESYNTQPSRQGDEMRVSRNRACIKKAIRSSGFLDQPIVGDGANSSLPPSRPYLAIQLAATYLVLDINHSFRSLRTDYDLNIVYRCDSSTPDIPIINASNDEENIDLYQLLHIRNFWKRHLRNRDENTFHKSYHNMPKIMRPKAWEEGLGNKGSLGTCWLGYYSCIHPLPISSTDLQERQTCADLMSHWESTSALLLKLPTLTTNASISTTWFPLFNEAYPINTNVEPSSRTYFRGTQSLNLDQNHHHHHHHDAHDDAHDSNDQPHPNSMRGFTEPCPAQAGIPGWRRICFIIYEINPEFFVSAADDNDNGDGGGGGGGGEGDEEVEGWLPWSWTAVDFLWAYGYEGVIVPGGGIMMGRWRNMMVEAEVEEGPFVFWVV